MAYHKAEGAIQSLLKYFSVLTNIEDVVPFKWLRQCKRAVAFTKSEIRESFA